MSVKKSTNRIQYMVPCKNQSCPVKEIILEDKTDFYRVLYNKWSVTGCSGLEKLCVPCIFLYRVVLGVCSGDALRAHSAARSKF